MRGVRHVALPLSCYYAITLALPLANGAFETGSAFTRHALVVLIVPIILIALVSTACEVAIRVCNLARGR
jgi:hypothetical protein